MGDQPAEQADGSGRTAAVLMATQALALLILAGVLLADLAAGSVQDSKQALTEAVLIVLFAVGAALLARGLFRGRAWARTPTLVWNLLLLPVAFSMLGAGSLLLGTVVLVVAVLSLAMTWRVPPVEVDAQ